MTYWLPVGAFLALAVKTLMDWREHVDNRAKRRADVVLLVLGFGAFLGTILKARVDESAAARKEHEAQVQHATDQAKIDTLQGQLAIVSNKLDDIKATVVSAPLLHKIDELHGQIDHLKTLTERPTAPAPKAKLEATFFTTDLPFKAQTHIEAMPIEGIITVPVAVHNSSDVLAMNTSIWVTTCKGCTIVDLPPGYLQPPGTEPWKVQAFGPRMEPTAITPKLDFRIKLPPGISSLTIAVEMFCDSCGPKKTDCLTVDISR
jgi:hypothetical protein